MLPVAVARSSPDDGVMGNVLPVLWMASCFHIMELVGQIQRRRVCFVEFARWRHQSDVSQSFIRSSLRGRGRSARLQVCLYWLYSCIASFAGTVTTRSEGGFFEWVVCKSVLITKAKNDYNRFFDSQLVHSISVSFKLVFLR